MKRLLIISLWLTIGFVLGVGAHNYFTERVIDRAVIELVRKVFKAGIEVCEDVNSRMDKMLKCKSFKFVDGKCVEIKK